ncbi:amino acid permease [candidate division KSB1 bacterium]|nr:amino acid permease [candidate division KSB1 bacterium]
MKKELTFLGIFSVSAGAMISSGLFILPGMAFARSGPGVIISYALAGLFALVGVFSVIELATAMPKAGGDYYFIHRSLGPMIGTVSGIIGWIALSLKSAFAIYGISETVRQLFGTSPFLTIIVCCAGFVLINIVGMKFANFFQTWLVAGLLVLLGIFIVFGIGSIQPGKYTPFIPHGVNSVFFTAGFIFISYGGLVKVASVSEEVKDLKKNLPRAMLSSIIIITLLYVMIIFVITGVIESETLAGASTPVADAARLTMGFAGFVIISIASLLAFITTANAGILSASRYPLGLSRDSLLPSLFQKQSKRFHTPALSVIITGIIIFLSLLFPIQTLVKSASTVILTSFVLTNLAVIIFREGDITHYKPSFTVPFYPWTQVFSILLFSFFIVELGLEAIEISLGLVLFSLGLYWFYGRKKSESEYALLHLVEQITQADLTTGILESELKEILGKRDNVKKQILDQLVAEAEILDLDGPMDLIDFFRITAETIADQTDMTVEETAQKLYEREKLCSTAVANSFAVPHLILKDKDKMLLVLARCKEGIRFSEKHKKIKVVFLFFGSVAQRDENLKAIASMACLARNSSFMDKMMNAEDTEALRELIIASKIE